MVVVNFGSGIPFQHYSSGLACADQVMRVTGSEPADKGAETILIRRSQIITGTGRLAVVQAEYRVNDIRRRENKRM